MDAIFKRLEPTSIFQVVASLGILALLFPPAAATGSLVLRASDFGSAYPGQNTAATWQPSAVSNSQVLIKELY